MHEVDHECVLKRAACQLVAQLPDNELDALKVLDYAKMMVRHMGKMPPPTYAEVIPLSTAPYRKGLAVVPTDALGDQSEHQDIANPG